MKARAGVRLHSLEVPLAGTTLLIPSAAIAEVINPISVTAVPFSQPWLMGVIGWRTLAIPVISMEVLLGMAPPAPTANGKFLVFYPMNGRRDWEFYALLSVAEPRPQALDGSQPVVTDSELPDSPYIAAGLKIANRPMLIPDFEELKKIFYP